MSHRIKLKKANMNLKPQALTLLLARRGMGKSTAAQWFVRHIAQWVDRIMVMCGNKDTMMDYEDVLNPIWIHPKSIQKLRELIQYQEARVGYDRSMYKRRNGGSSRGYVVPRHLRVALFIDDCGNDKTFMFSDEMDDLCANGRHYGIDMFVLCQYYTQFNSKNRTQVDYVGLSYNENAKQDKEIHAEYLSKACPNMKQFQRIYEACTTDVGHFCWINNVEKKAGRDVTKKIFFFKVPDPNRPDAPVGRVGTDIVSEYESKYSREHYDMRQPVTKNFREQGHEFCIEMPPEDESSVGHSALSHHRHQQAYQAPMAYQQPHQAQGYPYPSYAMHPQTYPPPRAPDPAQQRPRIHFEQPDALSLSASQTAWEQPTQLFESF